MPIDNIAYKIIDILPANKAPHIRPPPVKIIKKIKRKSLGIL